MSLERLKQELQAKANPEKAKISQGFFKTGKGEYGEGDIFLGLTSEEIKSIAKEYRELDLSEVEKMLNSKIHEYRMTALRILLLKYKKDRENIYNFYLKNTRNINNWDLVDVTCPHIVGNYLIDKNKGILYKLAKSENLWEKRIAIVSTFEFIRYKEFDDTLKIGEILLNDKHDLIHKAVGWMFREIGKKDVKVLETFLKKHYKKMPRTMLRYSIEKFNKEKRDAYLKGVI